MSRPRLTTRLSAGGLVLVEASGGAGKSVLIADAAHETSRHTITVRCSGEHAGADLFATDLVAGLTASGLPGPDALGEGDDAHRVVVTAMAAAPGGVLVAVDDAHHLGPPSFDLLARLAERLRPVDTVIVAGRDLASSGLGPVAGDILRDDDLSLDTDEQAALARGFGLTFDASARAAFDRVTGGRAALAALLGARLSGSTDPALELARIGAYPVVFQPLVDAALGTLADDERAAIVQFAHIGFASPELTAALGHPDLIGAVRRAGLPVEELPGAWWSIADSVREVVASGADPDPDAVRAVARALIRAGEPLRASALFIDAGRPDDAARVLTGLPSTSFGPADHAPLDALVDRLPGDVLAANPSVLLHAARTAHLAGRLHRRADLLRRAATAAAAHGDPCVARAIEAESLRERVREGDYTGGRRRALEVLDRCEPSETTTRAALLHAAGSAAVRLGDSREGERLLGEAVELYRRVGDAAGLADALIGLGYSVHCFAGEYDLAVERLREALEIDGLAPTLRAAAVAMVAEAYECAGRLEDAARAASLAVDLATRVGNVRLTGYAHWELARLAAARGDHAALVDALRATEAHRGDWFDHRAGGQYLAEAAELLSRVGDDAGARRYLERARAHPASVVGLCDLAEAALEARHGDPDRALVLVGTARAGVDPSPRNALMLALVQARAYLRAGDGRLAAAAAEVFDLGAALGAPDLPYAVDAALAGDIVGLAVEHGSDAAVRAWDAGHRAHVVVLGGCEVRLSGRPVPLPPGRVRALIGALAVHGGRAPVDVVLEALWPDEPPDHSRVLLRKLLSKTNSLLGEEIVTREGSDVLRFVEGTGVDAEDFADDARRALASADTDGPAAAVRARIALSRYRGDLLPDERYAEWAIVPRERLRARRRALLDLLLGEAERRRDLAVALELIEELIVADPDDEDRYLHAARLLLAAGQSGRARDYLRRADDALARLELPRSPAHEGLRAATGRH